MKLRLDLHVHTSNSRDAHTTPGQVASLCKAAGLDGLAITDHNFLSTITSDDVIIIPGIEVSTSDGHLLGLGVSRAIPRGLSADESIAQIHDAGGVAIVAHPYDLLRSSITPERLSLRPDAIEAVNSASFLHSISWGKAERFAKLHKLPRTGGSDSHIPETLGRAYTIIDADSKETSTILAAIRNGNIQPEGVPIGLRDRVRKLFR